jgi:hypothetical protein
MANVSNGNMNKISAIERTTHRMHTGPAFGDRALKVVVVYQDAATCKWARQACNRVQKLVGSENVRCTWWKMGDLAAPGVLAGAVSTAMRADVIVVALHAALPLPLSLCVWAEAWLPHRLPEAGSLLALIDIPASPDVHADHTHDYLRSIARQAHLDFLVEERRLKGRSAAKQCRAQSALSDLQLAA